MSNKNNKHVFHVPNSVSRIPDDFNTVIYNLRVSNPAAERELTVFVILNSGNSISYSLEVQFVLFTNLSTYFFLFRDKNHPEVTLKLHSQFKN